MGPLNDENKLQVDERTKTEKVEKSLKMYNIINFMTIRYKLTALGYHHSFYIYLQAYETS